VRVYMCVCVRVRFCVRACIDVCACAYVYPRGEVIMDQMIMTATVFLFQTPIFLVLCYSVGLKPTTQYGVLGWW